MQITQAPIPPSFDGNPFSYGFALFSLMILASASLAQVIRNVRELEPHARGYFSPITMWQAKKLCLYLTIFLGTWPDVAALLSWNEVSPYSMNLMRSMDRFFDGLTPLPFLAALVISARSEAHVAFQLVSQPTLHIDFLPTSQVVRKQAMMALLVAVIAAGVTAGKLMGATG